jgi:flagellar motor switch protein FliM
MSSNSPDTPDQGQVDEVGPDVFAPEDSDSSEDHTEVDLLLGDDQVAGGGSLEPREFEPSIQPYDFRRPARLSKERKRSLEAIYGLVAKALEGWLRGRVKDPLAVELHGVEELTFGEFSMTLPSPCTSFVIEQTGSPGRQGIVDFGQELAFFLVDRLLGGSGQTVLYERSLTPTERLLVRIVAERVTAQLTDAWKDYVELNLRVTGFESIPDMLKIANREDRVLVCTLTISTTDMSSPLSLCLPAEALETFFLATANKRVPVALGNAEERMSERRSAEGTLRSARIPVQARFKEIAMTLRDLAALKPGSVMKTGLSTDTELFLLVAGQKRFVGAPGKLGGNLAALVGQEIEPEPVDAIQPGRGGI